MALTLEDNVIKEQKEADFDLKYNLVKGSGLAAMALQNTTLGGSWTGDTVKQSLTSTSNCFNYPYQQNWGSYPVYIYQDHTAKAVKVLKDLEADGVLTINNVAQFIKLVEKIAKTLA